MCATQGMQQTTAVHAHPGLMASPLMFRKRSAGAVAMMASSSERARAPKTWMFSTCSTESWARRLRPAMDQQRAKHPCMWHRPGSCMHVHELMA